MTIRIMLALLCTVTILCAGDAFAAGDCSPVGPLPSHAASREPIVTPFDHHDFNVTRDGTTEPVTVSGKTCDQAYALRPGAPDIDDAKVQAAYRAELAKLGAQIVFEDDNNTVAKLTQGEDETWIAIYSLFADVHVFVLNKGAAQQVLTRPSDADYRLLGHMPSYVGSKTESSDDTVVYRTDIGKDPKNVSVQGKSFQIVYKPKPGASAESHVAVQSNYRAALNALNAQLLYTDENTTTARVDENGQIVWIGVYDLFDEINVKVVEEKKFVPPAPSDMKTALEKAGHLALYINFDFAKATLRQDSAPVIAQVVGLLKGDPALRVSLVGNTDDVGTHDYNTRLSQDRAAAVVAAIAKAGIDPARLTSSGAGPDNPIADNKTVEGRAKNRRVELVKS